MKMKFIKLHPGIICMLQSWTDFFALNPRTWKPFFIVFLWFPQWMFHSHCSFSCLLFLHRPQISKGSIRCQGTPNNTLLFTVIDVSFREAFCDYAPHVLYAMAIPWLFFYLMAAQIIHKVAPQTEGLHAQKHLPSRGNFLIRNIPPSLLKYRNSQHVILMSTIWALALALPLIHWINLINH